jgi:hypothetical protein
LIQIAGFILNWLGIGRCQARNQDNHSQNKDHVTKKVVCAHWTGIFDEDTNFLFVGKMRRRDEEFEV